VSIVIEPKLLKFQNQTFQWYPAQTEPGRLLIILHGWTGDEKSMWVFTRHLPLNYSILAPRAPHFAPEGGYSWRKIEPGTWGVPSVDDLRPALESLLAFLDDWSTSEGMNLQQFDLMGFSQGAAMAYTLTLLYPDRVHALAALSGFLPEGAENILIEHPLLGKPVFVSHGRQDKMIPVARAQEAVALLRASGVRVTYCESDAGHKVSKDCLHAMEEFFEEN
jgi:phospholipase/carboxylesterase